MPDINIIFHRPPDSLRVGGLDLAMNELSDALSNQGVSVYFADNLEKDEYAVISKHRSIGWFHGLWQSPYRTYARFYQEQGIPYVVSPHGMLEPWAIKHKAWKKWPYFYCIEKRILQKAQIVFATGMLEEQHLKTKLSNVKTAVIPLGLRANVNPDYDAARQELGWQPHETVLLFLSRIHPKKGLLELLQVLTQVPETEKIKLRMVIVGDGDKKHIQAVQAYMKQNERSLPKVEYVGPVWGEGKWRYLQGANLFCLTTYSENFGLAVLEALTVGTPILTTDQTPWASFKHQKGYYITTLNKNDIRETLMSYIKHAKWSAEERQYLAQTVKEQYAWDRVSKEYIRELTPLLSK